MNPRPWSTTLRLASVGMALLAGLLLVACAAKSVTSTTPPTASPSAQAGGGGPVTVADANNGQTVTLRVGTQLHVVLSSTYWQLQAGSDPSVLRIEVSPVTSPSPGCVPGAGCGTVAATFTTVAPGHATVVATRTTCGEAMLCQGSAGHYQVEVVVVA